MRMRILLLIRDASGQIILRSLASGVESQLFSHVMLMLKKPLSSSRVESSRTITMLSTCLHNEWLCVWFVGRYDRSTHGCVHTEVVPKVFIVVCKRLMCIR